MVGKTESNSKREDCAGFVPTSRLIASDHSLTTSAFIETVRPATGALITLVSRSLMVEILKDNARPEAGEVYGAMDMGWAKLVGQVAQAYRK
jgi:hypothetical protein